MTELSRDLVVKDSWLEAENVAVLYLGDPGGKPLPAWQLGAHLDVVLPSGLSRQYSLCGDPRDTRRYRIAVLREPGGRGGSVELHDCAPGSVLRACRVRNNFAFVEADKYVFIAGGIGITPILPMVQEVARSGKKWQLIYRGRSRQTMAFLPEIAHLDAAHVSILPSDEVGAWDITSIVSSITRGTAIYCCGPAKMLRAVEYVSQGAEGLATVHVERFQADADDQMAALPPDDSTITVHLHRSGITLIVGPDKSILEAVQEVVPDAPFSCQEGVCGSCETRVLDGVPEHHDYVLSDEERAESDTMMICVGRAKTADLTLDL